MNKKIITSMLCCALLSSVMSYAQKFDKPDKAPVDISYLTTRKIPKPLVKVVYGRPQKESNNVFGDQVPYGEIWRTGANEAVEITFYKDVTFGGKSVKAGTYALFTIPGTNEWTVILNNNLNQWGAYSYDNSADVVRVSAKASSDSESLEAFSIAFKSKPLCFKKN